MPTDHYIYLPVADPELESVAQKWAAKRPGYAVIVNRSTGSSKAIRRAFMPKLKGIYGGHTVYVLAHGASPGKVVGGKRGMAMSVLSMHNEAYFRDKYPVEHAKANRIFFFAKKSWDDGMNDEKLYPQIVEVFERRMTSEKSIEVTRPGALKVGGTRADGTEKYYTPVELFHHLKAEGLPQIQKLKIFACNSAIAPKDHASFAEELYNAMKLDYPNTQVSGYAGAVMADLSTRLQPKPGAALTPNASGLWDEFHTSGGTQTYAPNKKGARLVKPGVRNIIQWGTDNEDVPAHTLRVTFPGGLKIQGDMIVRENTAKPF